MIRLPRISVNGIFRTVHLPDSSRLDFSYETLIAFRTCEADIVVRKNEWGPTTGRHLNAIDGGNEKERVDAKTFAKCFQAAFPNLCQ